MATLSQKEVEILEHLERNKALSQRELAKAVGLSLGLVNILIRRLIQEGCLRVNHLNKKKVEYLLTPHGTTQHETIKSADTNKTIKKFKNIEVQLMQMLQELHSMGYRYFSIHGNGELRQLLEAVFRNCLANTSASLEEAHRDQPDSIVLNLMALSPTEVFPGRVVSVLERIQGL